MNSGAVCISSSSPISHITISDPSIIDLRDTEITPLNFTKSINLALSERGINALRSSACPELVDAIIKETLPMHGRMIHVKNAAGRLVEDAQAYDVHGRFQRSVDRGILNKMILNELDRLPNVKLLFQHKLTGADFEHKKAWFEVKGSSPTSSRRAPEIEIDFDLMIGADGAHSATRYHLMKYARMEYSQVYIDCLWSEFTMLPSEAGHFRISPNHLHIWPAGSFMFIALPNVDKSFTCTFFAPVHLFSDLENGSDQNLIQFFDRYFPGVTEHIAGPDLCMQFKRNPHLPLINIKCSPHHFGDSAVILGDAANAMVPFYGQGMNSGLESVRVLFEKLDSSQTTRHALESYTASRTADAHAIADLSLANYIEMRSSVTSRVYKLRKSVEEALDKFFPRLGWKTQYSRVSFDNMRYSKVIERARYQKQVLTAIFLAAVMLPSASIAVYLLRLLGRRRVWRR